MKRRRRSAAFLAAVLLSVSLAGCGEKSITPSSGGDAPGKEEWKMKRNRAATFAALALAAVLTAALPGCSAGAAVLAGPNVSAPVRTAPEMEISAQLVQSLRDFTAQTGAEALSQGKNVCYSPVSLYIALALAGTGAAGETQEELYRLLGAEDTQALAEDVQLLQRTLYQEEKRCSVYLANSLWMREGVDFYDSFTQRAAEQFYAESYTLDFAALGAGKAVGRWVSDHTKGLLQPEISLKADDILVLLNTVSFKANWVDAFPASATETADFTKQQGQTLACPFLRAARSGEAVTAEGWNLAGLPMEGGWQMFFLLPDEGESIDGLLAGQGLAALLNTDAAQYRQIEWGIPKFAVKGEIDLVPVLQRAGVERAFCADEADFSNLCDVSQLPGGVAYLSEVRQGTAFSIDEEGAEAVAYTKIVMDAGSAAPPEGEPVVMELNRPFLYGIWDSDGTVLFLGRCDVPETA